MIYCLLSGSCRLVILSGYLLLSAVLAEPGTGDTLRHEYGEPFLTFFSPEETGGAKQNWVILQAANGLIYVGNSDGLLEYDGSICRRHVIPNGTVRALAEDATGRLLVGGKEQFGFMQPDSLGSLAFVSLAGNLNAAVGIGNVWHISFSGGQTYFYPIINPRFHFLYWWQL